MKRPVVAVRLVILALLATEFLCGAQESGHDHRPRIYLHESCYDFLEGTTEVVVTHERFAQKFGKTELGQVLQTVYKFHSDGRILTKLWENSRRAYKYDESTALLIEETDEEKLAAVWNKVEWTTYSYDNSGRRIVELQFRTSYRGGKEPKYAAEWSYDQEGWPQVRTEYWHALTAETNFRGAVTRTFYDKRLNQQLCIQYQADGAEWTRRECAYDENGDLIEEKYSVDGALKNLERWTTILPKQGFEPSMDRNNQCTRTRREIDPRTGETTFTTLFSPRQDGTQLIATVLHVNGKEIAHSFTSKRFDNHDRLATVEYTENELEPCGDGTFKGRPVLQRRTNYKYDANGCIRTIEVFGFEGIRDDPRPYLTERYVVEPSRVGPGPARSGQY